MSDAFRKFVLKISLFTLTIFIISAALFTTVLKTFYLSVFPIQLLLIATITTMGHLWVIRSADQNPMKFTTAFMASVTLKLLVYLFFMLIYLLIDHSEVISFILTFIALYIAFTIFEVIQVLKFIKK